MTTVVADVPSMLRLTQRHTSIRHEVRLVVMESNGPGHGDADEERQGGDETMDNRSIDVDTIGHRNIGVADHTERDAEDLERLVDRVLQEQHAPEISEDQLPMGVRELLMHSEIIRPEFYPLSKTYHYNKVYVDGGYDPRAVYATPDERHWLVDPGVVHGAGSWFMRATVLEVHGNGQITSFPYWRRIRVVDGPAHTSTVTANDVKAAVMKMVDCVDSGASSQDQ